MHIYMYVILFCFRKLQKNAVPSIFPGLPERFQQPLPCPRSRNTNAESRRAAESQRMEDACDEFLASDAVDSYDGILNRIDQESLPEGFCRIQSTLHCILIHVVFCKFVTNTQFSDTISVVLVSNIHRTKVLLSLWLIDYTAIDQITLQRRHITYNVGT